MNGERHVRLSVLFTQELCLRHCSGSLRIGNMERLRKPGPREYTEERLLCHRDDLAEEVRFQGYDA